MIWTRATSGFGRRQACCGLATRDLDAAVALHEAGLTPQQQLREAMLIALSDLAPSERRAARRVLQAVSDALAKPPRRGKQVERPRVDL
jgi:hypothetical protein